ncbi:MAG: Csu type fimbrial protein [Methylocella sp.]
MKPYSCSIVAAIAGVFLCGCSFFSAAQAQSCSFTATNVAFGTVDVTANAAVNTTATVSITCSALLGSPAFKVCVDLGAGSGGATSAANRFMLSGANTLTYGLFSDAARTIPWGSSLWAGGGANAVLVNFPGLPLLGGHVTETATVYGQVYSGQQTVMAGSYLSTFSSTNAEIMWPVSSSNCTGFSGTATTSFNVTATVPTTCRIATNNLNFGTVGVLAANMDATTMVAPDCTNGTPYNVGLNGGLSGATDPTQRKMTNGAAFVLYGLYRDSARSLPFGNTIGTNTLVGTGTGLAQSATVYGRIAPQATPAPATYTDTIVVTLTY